MSKFAGLSTNSIKLAALLITGVALASCQSQKSPEPAVRQQPTAVVVGPQPVSTAPTQVRSTNTYPTFDRQLTAAGTQMSDEEAKEMQANLSGLPGRRGAGAVSQSEYNRRVQELRQIANEQKPAAN